MPMPAAPLSDAIAFTNGRVGVGNAIGFLNFYITTFNNLWAPAFNPENVNDRTVRNWIVFTRVVQNKTPTSGNSQERQEVVNAAVRVMYAAEAAHAAGRITTAQRDAVLGAWNSSFGAIP